MGVVRARPERISALDFTKGVLVLIMVLYHWLNYFIYRQTDVYLYLRFLTPSFICISGFLISHVLLPRYGTAHSRLPQRLVSRGLKILAVFVVLNLIRSFLFAHSPNGKVLFTQITMANLTSIYLTGNMAVKGVGKEAAFLILVPISYLLLLSAVLAIFSRYYKHAFQAAGLLFLASALILSFNNMEYANLELLAIGLLGAVLGYIRIERINSLVNHVYILAAAYVCYLAAITVWGSIFSLQIAGVLLSLLVIYLVGMRSGARSGSAKSLILLGRYSLFAYIAQIIIIQVLHSALRSLNPGVGALAASFVTACVLTFLSVALLERWRERSALVDGLYKAVFA